HVPRPPNCFMIFRSEFLALHSDETQTKASKLAGAAWRKLPKERKDHYKELAKDRKEDHARAHPGYKYKPRRSK
ncbi:HMG-box, partial [Guyanagaster necrorhizus]